MTRLIDADALYTELVKMNDYGYLTAKKAIRRVKQSPTIDAEPVRHGKWIPFDLTWGRTIYSCSVCKDGCDVDVVNGIPIYAYCPNCGARMDEERKEEWTE